MPPTLQEQLSALPIPRLTTVLRVNFDLPPTNDSFAAAISLVETWWNRKAEPYQTNIGPDLSDFSFEQVDFRVEFARTNQTFSLAMEEPDSSVAGRTWICDFALRKSDGLSQFAVRVSFRQLQNVFNQPEPRAPRFLRDIVDRVGAVDFWQLKSAVQIVEADGLPFFQDLIESPQRSMPVVVISEDDRSGEVSGNADSLSRYLSGTAHVVRLTSEASWQLSRDWGRDWSTFQGAIRCYNPHFSRNDDKYKHRLWLPEVIQRMDAGSKNGFLNVCVGYVFTQVTAQFESLPLLTPSVVRRQIEETARQTQLFRSLPTIEEDFSAQLGSISNLPLGAAGAMNPPDTLASDSTSQIARQLQGLANVNTELELRIKKQEETSGILEAALQQERAGRAESERLHLQTKDDLELYAQEVQNLEQQKSIALGNLADEPSAALKPLWQNFNGFFNSLQNVASQFRRFERDSLRITELEQQLSAAGQTVNNLRATIESINRKSLGVGDDLSPAQIIQQSRILELIPQLAQKNPPLRTSLEVIATVFPERVVVLESAMESASQSQAFRHGDKAFELLWLLPTQYWKQIQSGSGDTEARKVFGSAYAPREGETLSKAGQARRTFDFESVPHMMEKHLKIGTADNTADTVRIHFEWVAFKKLIVIGHCGRHLAF